MYPQRPDQSERHRFQIPLYTTLLSVAGHYAPSSGYFVGTHDRDRTALTASADRPSDVTSVTGSHTSRATAGERKDHSSPKDSPFHKVRVFVFWFAIIGSGTLFSLHYLRGEGDRLAVSDNIGDTTTTSQPTGASLRAHTAMPTAAPIAQAVPESSRKVFQKPKAYIGEEPNEYLEVLQAFDDKVDRLVRELEIALENAGPVRVQSKQNTDEIAMTKTQPRIQQRIFDEMEFEGGVETYGMLLGDPYYAFDDDEVRKVARRNGTSRDAEGRPFTDNRIRPVIRCTSRMCHLFSFSNGPIFLEAVLLETLSSYPQQWFKTQTVAMLLALSSSPCC